jgi:hypothetical protein
MYSSGRKNPQNKLEMKINVPWQAQHRINNP